MPLFWLSLLVVTALWLPTAFALALVFPSPQGKLAALWTLLPLLTLWLLRPRPRWAAATGAGALVGLAGLLLCYPFPREELPVRASPAFPHPLDLVFNFVPESDLSELGVGLAYTGPTHSRVTGLLRPLYAEMASDPMYRHLPHVVGATASDLLLRAPGREHLYLFVPPGEGKKPALIFYHGALGNFSVYLHFWRKWAQDKDWIVVCPSNGFGRWYDAAGEERALASFDRALAELPIDPSRVLVAGMSNGGTAVTRLVNARPSSIAATLYVCPVLEQEQILTPTFLEWTKNQPPPIVLEGSEDINVPPEAVAPRVEAILGAGGRCDYRLLEGHDHHLLFSAQEEVFQAADRLARALESSGQPVGSGKGG